MLLNEVKKPKTGVPEWVPELDSKFKAILRGFGYDLRAKPSLGSRQGDLWTFGNGDLKFIEKDSALDEDDIINGLSKEMAKFLIGLSKSGRIVQVVNQIHEFRTDVRLVQPDDNVNQIAQMIRAAAHFTTDYQTHRPIWRITWRIESPREFTAPTPQSPKTVIRVKRGT